MVPATSSLPQGVGGVMSPPLTSPRAYQCLESSACTVLFACNFRNLSFAKAHIGFIVISFSVTDMITNY